MLQCETESRSKEGPEKQRAVSVCDGQPLLILRQDKDSSLFADRLDVLPVASAVALTFTFTLRQEEEASRQNDGHHRRAIHHLLGTVPHGPHAL